MQQARTGSSSDDCSGSQCGFCTPGIVMSLYALIRNSYQNGKFHLTPSDVELEGHLDGNLCRCVSPCTVSLAHENSMSHGQC